MRLTALFLALAVAACSPAQKDHGQTPAPKAAPAHPQLHAVAEQFEVGTHAYVRGLHLDHDTLYVGTSVGVLLVDKDTGDMRRTFTRDDGMRNPYAFVVRPGPDGALWMGTNAGGLAVHQDGAMKSYLPKHGLADPWVYDVAFDGDDKVWLGTWDGVNLIQGDRDKRANWTTYNVADGLANPWVYAIQIDADGAVWFGTEGGLSRLHNGEWTTWRHGDGLGGDNPRGLPRSPKSGFGSNRSGAHSHDLTTLTEDGAETYNQDYVFSLRLDAEGDLWIGTWGGGVSRFDGKTFTNFTEKEGLAGDVVYAIDQGPDGAMWFGTNHGLSRFDGSRWTTYNRDSGLLGDDIYTVTVDADSHAVWAGQKGGVSKLVPLPPPTAG